MRGYLTEKHVVLLSGSRVCRGNDPIHPELAMRSEISHSPFLVVHLFRSAEKRQDLNGTKGT